MHAWKFVVLGLSLGVATPVACSKSSAATSANCAALTACCPTVYSVECAAIAEEGIDATCVSYCAGQMDCCAGLTCDIGTNTCG